MPGLLMCTSEESSSILELELAKEREEFYRTLNPESDVNQQTIGIVLGLERFKEDVRLEVADRLIFEEFNSQCLNMAQYYQ